MWRRGTEAPPYPQGDPAAYWQAVGRYQSEKAAWRRLKQQELEIERRTQVHSEVRYLEAPLAFATTGKLFPTRAEYDAYYEELGQYLPNAPWEVTASLGKLLEKGWKIHTYNLFDAAVANRAPVESLAAKGDIGRRALELAKRQATLRAQPAPKEFARLRSLLPPKHPELILWLGGFLWSVLDFATFFVPGLGQVRAWVSLIELLLALLTHPEQLGELLRALASEVAEAADDLAAVLDPHAAALPGNSYDRGRHAGTLITSLLLILMVSRKVSDKLADKLEAFAKKANLGPGFAQAQRVAAMAGGGHLAVPRPARAGLQSALPAEMRASQTAILSKAKRQLQGRDAAGPEAEATPVAHPGPKGHLKTKLRKIEAFVRAGGLKQVTGRVTATEARLLGEHFVGPGFTESTGAKGEWQLTSGNGLRHVRGPTHKPTDKGRNVHPVSGQPHSRTGLQMNFESRDIPKGVWTSNVHLDVEQ